MALVCGLDIGDAVTKAVLLERTGDRVALRSAIMTPTPGKGLMSESPIDQEEMAQTINRLFTDGHIQTKEVHMALPESQVFTRVIEMPVLSNKELASAIYWEAEQYIPVPLSSVTLDYKVLSRPKEGEAPTMRVLLVGAPTALIDKYEHVMTLSGLSISSLETELLSVARVASPLCADQKDPARIIPTLCISMGAMSTSLALLRDGGITFAYTTPTGGSALTRAIASDFGFSLNQAEAYKKTYGISDGEIGVKLRKAIDPIIESIITEIKKAINTHNEQFGSDPLQQILLSGGAAKLPGLTHVLTSTLGHETVLLDPWKSLEGYAQLPKEMRDDAPDYAIAVGLALREEHE